MTFIQFVAPLIGGYWFLLTWNYTKYVVRQDSGYHLFFKSSIAGIFFLIVATQLVFLYDFFEYGIIARLIPNGFDSSSILAMTIGIVSSYLLNIFSNKRNGLARAAESRGKYLQLMIQQAFDQLVMIEVALKDGKVYIGVPLNEMPFDSEDLNLFLFFSGYRESETKQLIISKSYAKEMDSILDADKYPIEQGLFSKFSLIAPVKEVAYARFFDKKIFEKLNSLDS